MQIWRTIQEVGEGRQSWGSASVGFVPTMGALHEGHQALIKAAKEKAQRVVVSIFVNPTQFGPQEDFQSYPRPEADDLSICEALGVDAVFIPSVEQMYPVVDKPWMEIVPPSDITEQLCGLNRPGHFNGVATVVLKLFNLVQPHFSVFGEKDAQQLAVIRRLVSDLNLSVQIVAYPIVREKSGLAMSSRNRYFQTPFEKEAALLLIKTLKTIQEQLTPEATLTHDLLLQLVDKVVGGQPQEIQALFQLEYIQARDYFSLKPTQQVGPNTLLLMAAKIGKVRLIDNLRLGNS